VILLVFLAPYSSVSVFCPFGQAEPFILMLRQLFPIRLTEGVKINRFAVKRFAQLVRRR
jgi:hypothetical protein